MTDPQTRAERIQQLRNVLRDNGLIEDSDDPDFAEIRDGQATYYYLDRGPETEVVSFDLTTLDKRTYDEGGPDDDRAA